MKLKQFLILVIAAYICLYFIKIFFVKKSKTDVPIILWWTPLTSDRKITCTNNVECIISTDQSDLNSKHLKAVMFYGSNIDENSLPKKNKHTWAIYHEESPKNLPIFLNQKIQSLFEITSTFSRHSSFPLTFHYLKSLNDLTSKEYYVDLKIKNVLLKTLAPVLYVQRDCQTPISRDKYVSELMKYVKVDSYGDCLNNKALPDKFKLKNGVYDLYNAEFMQFVARYKFIIAIENAECEDYITEKLWRALMVGSIPIYLGSPSIKDWLPNNNSALIINDFDSPEMLAKEIIKINKDDDLYVKYMDHKIENRITNKLLIERMSKGNYGIGKDVDSSIIAFECFVCDNLHFKALKYDVNYNKSIYDCLPPKDAFWMQIWDEDDAKAKELIKKIF